MPRQTAVMLIALLGVTRTPDDDLPPPVNVSHKSLSSPIELNGTAGFSKDRFAKASIIIYLALFAHSQATHTHIEPKPIKDAGGYIHHKPTPIKANPIVASKSRIINLYRFNPVYWFLLFATQQRSSQARYSCHHPINLTR